MYSYNSRLLRTHQKNDEYADEYSAADVESHWWCRVDSQKLRLEDEDQYNLQWMHRKVSSQIEMLKILTVPK